MNRYNNMLDLVCALASNSAVASVDVLARAKQLLDDMQEWEKANPDPNVIGLVDIVRMRDDLQAARLTIDAQTTELETARAAVAAVAVAGLVEK